MRCIAALCALCAAGCTTPAEELMTMRVPEVCYLGATQWEYRRAADDELKRRGEVCENYRDEILALHKRRLEAGANTGTGFSGPQTQQQYISMPPGMPK